MTIKQQIEKETCKLLYVNERYFTDDDISELYMAATQDNHGCLVCVEETAGGEDDLSCLSETAQAIMKLALEYGIAWLRLDPDGPTFKGIQLPKEVTTI